MKASRLFMLGVFFGWGYSFVSDIATAIWNGEDNVYSSTSDWTLVGIRLAVLLVVWHLIDRYLDNRYVLFKRNEREIN